MEAAEANVGRRSVRQFRTTQEKRFIVEETRKTGVSVATVAQAHGVNANQVFYWRKLYEAGQLESTPGLAPRDLGAACGRLLPVSVDEGAGRQHPVIVVGSAAGHTEGGDGLPGSIELTLAAGKVTTPGA